MAIKKQRRERRQHDSDYIEETLYEHKEKREKEGQKEERQEV